MTASALPNDDRNLAANAPKPKGDDFGKTHHLTVAPQSRAAARGLFGSVRPSVVGFTVGIVAIVIIAAQLCLSILQTSDAYKLDSLKVQQRDTERVERVLQQNVESLSSPQNLAENAKALGMVQNVQPAYLRLSDGKVLGNQANETEDSVTNSVPNDTLGSVPLVDGKTGTRQAAAGADKNSQSPVVWKGNLPAPDTH
jgi:hypothetical protein